MVQPGNVDENKRATLRRFAVLGAATPLTKLADGDHSGERSEARDAIAGYVTTTPGAHFSKVRDDLKLGTGETQHHLRQLVELGVVEVTGTAITGAFSPPDSSPRSNRSPRLPPPRTPRGMLIELLRNPDATGGDLAAALDVSRPTVSKYAADLDEKGLLSREDGYAVRHPETVITLLVRYADSFDANAETVRGRSGESDIVRPLKAVVSLPHLSICLFEVTLGFEQRKQRIDRMTSEPTNLLERLPFLRADFPRRGGGVSPLLDFDVEVPVRDGGHVRADFLRGESELVADEPGFEVGFCRPVFTKVPEDTLLFVSKRGRASSGGAHTSTVEGYDLSGFGTSG